MTKIAWNIQKFVAFLCLVLKKLIKSTILSLARCLLHKRHNKERKVHMRVKAWRRGDILPYLAHMEKEERAVTWAREAVQFFDYIYSEVVNSTGEVVYFCGWKDKILC